MKLADRIEQADGPSRELDAEIEAMFTDERGTRPLKFFQHEIANGYRRPPRFTASIDAAMTLVPEGWSVEKAGWHSLGDPDAYFELWEYTDRSGWLHGSENKRAKGRAATPALALCAAALRAQEAGE